MTDIYGLGSLQRVHCRSSCIAADVESFLKKGEFDQITKEDLDVVLEEKNQTVGQAMLLEACKKSSLFPDPDGCIAAILSQEPNLSHTIYPTIPDFSFRKLLEAMFAWVDNEAAFAPNENRVQTILNQIGSG